MNLIIHHLTAWQSAVAKYKFETAETPQSWPVLVSFIPYADLPVDDDDLPISVPAAVITVDMAAKMLAGCTSARLGHVDKTTMAKLYAAIHVVKQQNQMKTGMMSTLSGIVQVPESDPMTGTVEAINQSDGKAVTLSGFPASVGFKVGQIITFNSQQYIITGTNSIVQGIDPIDGTEGALIVADEPSKIPGLEEIPMDPSKMDEGTKIADLGDPTEHVLDVERSI